MTIPLFSGKNLSLVRKGRLLGGGALSFSLKEGEILLVRGKNGSGKSSFLRLLAGLLPGAGGRFFWKDQEIIPEHAQHRRHVAYLGHQLGIDLSSSVLEELKSVCRESDIPQKLKALELAFCQHLPLRLLSRGQQQRVALCRLILSQRPLWLLDEPTSHLDRQAQERLYQEITAHTQVGGVVVLTSHDTLPLKVNHVLAL